MIDASIILQGKQFKLFSVLLTHDAYVRKTNQHDSAKLWHAQLAHVGHDKLKEVFQTRKLP